MRWRGDHDSRCQRNFARQDSPSAPVVDSADEQHRDMDVQNSKSHTVGMGQKLSDR
jgi:hypothetical protein